MRGWPETNSVTRLGDEWAARSASGTPKPIRCKTEHSASVGTSLVVVPLHGILTRLVNIERAFQMLTTYFVSVLEDRELCGVLSSQSLAATRRSIQKNPSTWNKAMIRQPVASSEFLFDAHETFFDGVSEDHVVLQLLRPSDRDHQLLALTERSQLSNCGSVRSTR